MRPEGRSIEATLPPGSHPRHAWLGFVRHVPPGAERITFEMRQMSHCFLHLRRGEASGRLIVRGEELRVDGTAGAVQFHAADGSDHHLDGKPHAAGCTFAALIIPPPEFERIAAADGVDRIPEPRIAIWPNDATLGRCLEFLALPAGSDTGVAAEDLDEAARSLVLRLADLFGAPVPDWCSDTGSFDRRTLADIVERIDDRLAAPPTAAELAAACGISPSHFAKKFRRTTGLSLGRFLIRRRVKAALAGLRHPGVELAGLALDLGFASQSHFTRAFVAASGMSPSAYRRQFRMTAG